MIYGNVWDNTDYPPSIEVNPTLKKVRFFLGDRWLTVGKWQTTIENKGRNTACISIELPDILAFIEQREILDDGTLDWYAWGPRVN